MDIYSRAKRSRIMACIKRRDTMPELRVRRALHRLGYRFRLHRKDLPGTPDIVLPRHRTIIFVHGCFWHGHPGCPRASSPSTRREYWEAKFAANVHRDERNQADLMEQGWRVLTLWECETIRSAVLDEILKERMRQGLPMRENQSSLKALSVGSSLDLVPVPRMAL